MLVSSRRRPGAAGGGLPGPGAGAGSFRPGSDGAEQPVAGVAEAGHDVPAVVQPLVQPRGHHADLRRAVVREGGSHALDSSGAASRQIAVTAAAPRETSMAITVCSVPPVASIGSRTKASRLARSAGRRAA